MIQFQESKKLREATCSLSRTGIDTQQLCCHTEGYGVPYPAFACESVTANLLAVRTGIDTFENEPYNEEESSLSLFRFAKVQLPIYWLCVRGLILGILEPDKGYKFLIPHIMPRPFLHRKNRFLSKTVFSFFIFVFSHGLRSDVLRRTAR